MEDKTRNRMLCGRATDAPPETMADRQVCRMQQERDGGARMMMQRKRPGLGHTDPINRRPSIIHRDSATNVQAAFIDTLTTLRLPNFGLTQQECQGPYKRQCMREQQ